MVYGGLVEEKTWPVVRMDAGGDGFKNVGFFQVDGVVLIEIKKRRFGGRGGSPFPGTSSSYHGGVIVRETVREKEGRRILGKGGGVS